jgi:hypothetical protein
MAEEEHTDVAISGELLVAKAGRIVISRSYPDGRLTGIVEWPDGFWQVEVFASDQHLQNEAEKHDMEIVDER